MKNKNFWKQYGSIILLLGGIIVGSLIGMFALNCSPLSGQVK